MVSEVIAEYLVDVAATLLFPDAGANLSLILAAPAGISEVAFLMLLLVKGATPRRSEDRNHPIPVEETMPLTPPSDLQSLPPLLNNA